MQMPTTIKTICLFCGEYVEDKQIKRNKAVCEDCDVTVYGTEIQKPVTPQDFYKKKIEEEGKVFTEMMKRVMFKIKK